MHTQQEEPPRQPLVLRTCCPGSTTFDGVRVIPDLHPLNGGDSAWHHRFWPTGRPLHHEWQPCHYLLLHCHKHLLRKLMPGQRPAAGKRPANRGQRAQKNKKKRKKGSGGGAVDTSGADLLRPSGRTPTGGGGATYRRWRRLFGGEWLGWNPNRLPGHQRPADRLGHMG
jgi:hypothetical protein